VYCKFARYTLQNYLCVCLILGRVRPFGQGLPLLTGETLRSLLPLSEHSRSGSIRLRRQDVIASRTSFLDSRRCQLPSVGSLPRESEDERNQNRAHQLLERRECSRTVQWPQLAFRRGGLSLLLGFTEGRCPTSRKVAQMMLIPGARIWRFIGSCGKCRM
jgi:hypothetical protein